ncbi:MAG: ABC transporter ATP-binding protein [Candidatus Hodarchaeales archaeon]
MSIALKTENLTKSYNKTVVVDHLTLHVNKGEIVCLLGPNGSGKSTILKMLTTLLKPDEGTAYIYGFDIVKEQDKVRKSISYAPQELVFYEELTALENLVFFGMMQEKQKKQLVKEAKVILEKLGLIERTDKVKNFSGGMKRRLNLAINLIMDTEILFLDEVTAGLDPQSQHTVWKLLRELKNNDRTIILTTHDMNEAETLSDRVLIMDEGKIIASGTSESLKGRFCNENTLEIVSDQKLIIQELIKQIKSLEYVKNIVYNNDGMISIFFAGGIKNLVKILNQEKFSDLTMIKELNLRQSTLEDVFLILAGRNFNK